MVAKDSTAMSELPVSTVYLLKRAELAVRGCCELAFAEADLTPSQYFILFLVKIGEASSSAELARSMGVLPQSMTELIAPLERKGAIVRRPDPANNRILRIELTAEGERVFAKATEIAIRLENELLDGFDPRELTRVNRALEELTAKAEAHSFHPKLRRLTKADAKPKPAPPARKVRPKRRASSRR
jgi:DNA-binding MarR family transcriptional regulator